MEWKRPPPDMNLKVSAQAINTDRTEIAPESGIIREDLQKCGLGHHFLLFRILFKGGVQKTICRSNEIFKKRALYFGLADELGDIFIE